MSYRLIGIMILLAGLLPASQTLAQRGRAGGGGRSVFSALNFDYEYISSAGLNNPGPSLDPELELEITTLKARLRLPPLGMRRPGRDRERGNPGGWMILHSLEYHQRRISYGNWDALNTVSQLDRLHGIGYDFSLTYRPSRSWRAAMIVNPGVYSNLEGSINSDHWNVQTALLLDRVLDSGFVIGIGASWSSVLGKNMALPLLHLESRIGSNPRVRIILPNLAECSWRIDGGIELGAAARLDGNRYALGRLGTAGSGNTIDRLRYANLTLGPFVKFRISRGWSLILEGGGTVFRRFETSFADTIVDEYELNNSSFFRLGLRAGR